MYHKAAMGSPSTARSTGASKRCLLVLGAGLLPSVLAAGQASQPQAVPDLTGRVVNALTGAAVPRALVSMNSRTVLTDASGQVPIGRRTERWQ